jgi:hypothetical protein
VGLMGRGNGRVRIVKGDGRCRSLEISLHQLTRLGHESSLLGPCSAACCHPMSLYSHSQYLTRQVFPSTVSRGLICILSVTPSSNLSSNRSLWLCNLQSKRPWLPCLCTVEIYDRINHSRSCPVVTSLTEARSLIYPLYISQEVSSQYSAVQIVIRLARESGLRLNSASRPHRLPAPDISSCAILSPVS